MIEMPAPDMHNSIAVTKQNILFQGVKDGTNDDAQIRIVNCPEGHCAMYALAWQ